jgi:hypothetical protein
MSATVRITSGDFARLHAHLFPGDNDEHAAFLLAGEMISSAGSRLLVREVIPVPEEQFVASDVAYRRIEAVAVGQAALRAEELGLRLAAVHSHPGAVDHVAFSEPDLLTHARAHPGLIELTGGHAVSSLVFGRNAVAGERWNPDGSVVTIDHLDVVGTRFRRLTAVPQRRGRAGQRYARQLLLFGEMGQAALREMTVAVLGAGGGGSLLVQALAHLGVGTIIVVDFDRISFANLSRVVGSRPVDARRSRLKVDVMARMVAAIDPTVRLIARTGNVAFADDAREIATEADFVFSATDTMEARYAFNAITHQYLIPGLQVGVKVIGGHDARAQGAIDLDYVAVRAMDLDGPCMECQNAIDPELLHREQLGEIERRNQDYVDHPDDEGLAAPSVITLNSVSVAIAVTEFQYWATGMLSDGSSYRSRFYYPGEADLRERVYSSKVGCRFCDRTAGGSSFARGDDFRLPLRPGRAPQPKRSLREQLLCKLHR